MKIMITQNNPDIRKRLCQAYNFRGFGPSIDKVSGQPEFVPGFIEHQLVKKAAKRAIATLNVAHGIGSHLRGLVPREQAGDLNRRFDERICNPRFTGGMATVGDDPQL